MNQPETLGAGAAFLRSITTQCFAHLQKLHVLIGLVAAALMVFGMLLRARARTATSLVVMFTGALVFSASLGVYAVEQKGWGYVLALLPAALITRHAIFLWMMRRPGVRDATERRRALAEAGFSEDKLEPIFTRYESARQAHARDFAPDVIAVRFGIPALLAFLIGTCVFRALGADPLIHSGLTGARFGALGAFVYVMLYLGQRSFQRDITTGSAMWAALSLALGPVVGGIVEFSWVRNDGQGAWSHYALYFVAGLAPRQVAHVIEEAVRRLWLTRPGSIAGLRTRPLTEIRGIGSETEERLREEGILDAYALAFTDPLKLYRNTSFDMRQILSWIDEALLLISFPEKWQDLQRNGITGAIDLASLDPRAAAGNEAERTQKTRARKMLAQVAQIPEEVLEPAISRLYEDAQVELVWALYQYDEQNVDQLDEADNTTASRPMARLPIVPFELVANPSLGPVWAIAIAIVLFLAAAFAWTAPAASLLGVVRLAAALGVGGAGWALYLGHREARSSLLLPFVLFVIAVALIALTFVLRAPPPIADWNAGPVLTVAASLLWGAALGRLWFERRLHPVHIALQGDHSDVVKRTTRFMHDGQRISAKAGTASWLLDLPRGHHAIRVELDNHHPCLIDVEVPTTQVLSVALEPIVRISVELSPPLPNAVVTVDDQPAKVTNGRAIVSSARGTRRIEVAAPGYELQQLIRTLEADVNVPVKLVALRRYTLHIDPPAAASTARVFLDHQPVEASFIAPAGQHELRVESRGYDSYAETIELGDDRNLFVALRQLVEVRLDVTPTDANVRVKCEGRVRATTFMTTPGVHQLEIAADGFEPQSISLKVPNSAKFGTTIALQPVARAEG